MTNWEFRARIILILMKVLRLRLDDFYNSYPYNPYNETEVDAFWSDVERQHEYKTI